MCSHSLLSLLICSRPLNAMAAGHGMPSGENTLFQEQSSQQDARPIQGGSAAGARRYAVPVLFSGCLMLSPTL